MTDKNHEILDMQSAKAWLLSHVPQNSKATLFIDSKFLENGLVDVLFEKDSSLIQNFASVIINGSVGKLADRFDHSKIPNLSFIKKKIESPIPFSISVGRKAYLYLDADSNIRSSSDDQEIGRVIEGIHSSFDSLSWK